MTERFNVHWANRMRHDSISVEGKFFLTLLVHDHDTDTWLHVDNHGKGPGGAFQDRLGATGNALVYGPWQDESAARASANAKIAAKLKDGYERTGYQPPALLHDRLVKAIFKKIGSTATPPDPATPVVAEPGLSPLTMTTYTLLSEQFTGGLMERILAHRIELARRVRELQVQQAAVEAEDMMLALRLDSNT